jgi:hypothetical protein
VDFNPAKIFDYGLAGVALLLVARFHWHAVRVTIPGLIDAFKGEMAAQRLEQKADREQHDRHVTALVGRIDRIEADLDEVKEALGPRPLRIYRPDDEPAA